MQQRTTGDRKISPHTAQQDSSTPRQEMSTSMCEIQCSTDGSLPGSKTYVPSRVCTMYLTAYSPAALIVLP